MKRIILGICWLACGGLLWAADTKPPGDTKGDRFHWSDLLPRSFQKNPRINVAVHTNLTVEGKKRPVASKEHPVYYALVDGGLAEEGETVAGEKPPNPAKLAEVLKTSLANSGFILATMEHLPTIIIAYRWGSYNHLASIDADPENDMLDTSDPLQMKNLMIRAALVGGPKFSQDMLRALSNHSLDFFQMQGEDNESLVSMALGDLYFVLAVAFDGEGAKQGKKIALWTTQIATDSGGLMMEETLPALVASSRDYFGHETKGAVLFYPRIYPGHVEIGTPTVVDGPDPTPAPQKKGQRR